MPPAAVPVVTGQPTPASRTATAPSAPAESSMGVVLGITIRSVHDPAYAAAVTERSAQTPLFSPAVRRDLYAIVLNPSAPGAPAADPSGYGVALIGKPSVLGGALDTLAYVDRAALPALLSEWTLFEDSVLLESLQQIGLTTAPALATTLAFEQYLAATARAAWTTDTVQRLSCEFLVAFAVEMTPRLDINHRVRSCKLSAADVATLSTAPFASFVDQGMLRTFQTAALPAVPCLRAHPMAIPDAAAASQAAAAGPSSSGNVPALEATTTMATPMVQTSSLTLVVVVENGELAPDVVAQIVDDEEDIALTPQGRDADGRMLFLVPDAGKALQLVRRYSFKAGGGG